MTDCGALNLFAQFQMLMFWDLTGSFSGFMNKSAEDEGCQIYLCVKWVRARPSGLVGKHIRLQDLDENRAWVPLSGVWTAQDRFVKRAITVSAVSMKQGKKKQTLNKGQYPKLFHCAGTVF